MPDPVDLYIDQFQIASGPFGCTIGLFLSPAVPAAPGVVPQPERIATIRLGLESMKTLAFLLRRQVIQHEDTSGTEIQIPLNILNQIGIGPDDWQSFWRRNQ